MTIHIFLALIILGAVQGITEFLPISSSGHLVILENIHYFKKSLHASGQDINLLINVFLHLATLLAVILFLKNDIYILIKGLFIGLKEKDYSKREIKIVINILAASIPAGLMGILLHSLLKKVFSSATIAFIFLIFNGIVLIATKKIPIKDRNIEEIGIGRSIFIGFCQAIAIMPGISRSGMTIAGGMFAGLKPLEAAKFSFLMAIPVITGAGFLEGVKVAQGSFPKNLLIPFIVSMIITVLVALISLKILFHLVKKIKIDIFGYYTIALGIIGLIIFHLF